MLAGLVVGVVALPLSMALAIAVGVPPQHGLYTAIVAGLVVPLPGGSRFQVTGPTAAFVVILAKPGHQAGATWSTWAPEAGSANQMANQIAEHVAHRYRLSAKGGQLVAIVPSMIPSAATVKA